MKSAKSARVFLTGLLGALVWLSPLAADAQDNLWRSHGPTDASDVTGVALDPTNTQVLYAVSGIAPQGSTGIRKSLDGGLTWIELGGGDPALSGLTCLSIDASNSSNVYVGTAQGVVAASHDAGATWSKATVGTFPVSAIAVEPASGSVYAATRPTGNYFFALSYGTPLSRSTDGGNTWHATNLKGPRGVYALLADALHQTLLAGTDFAYPSSYYGQVPQGGGVAGTKDAGATWALPASDVGFSVTALAGDSVSGHLFAATSVGQILRSGDAGGSWTALGKLAGTVSAIAVDPTSGSTLYAGLLHGGVWRSADGGATWHLFDAGLTSGAVSSLAIDPTGNLYAGTRQGVFHRSLPAVSAARCQPGDDHLCLLGSRFRVDLYAMDPHTQAAAPAKALPKGDRFGYFSLPSLTGDPTLPEVFVKMLDAAALPGQGTWFFSTALTNVSYSLVVTDTTNGAVQSYDGQAFCGTADIRAFPTNTPAAPPAGARNGPSTLAASGSELILLSHRFRIALSATDPHNGVSVPGVAIPQGDRFGYFSLPAVTGDPTFPEVFVKMLDARSLPDGDFWLFQSGLTSLSYSLTVTDTLTGADRIYRNDPADPTRLCGGADTRVTTGPEPVALSGQWEGTSELFGTAPAEVSVTHSGEHLEMILLNPHFPTQLSVDGVVRLGSLEGTARAEYGCHFESAASGAADSSKIQLTYEILSGTCGTLDVGGLDLTPVADGNAKGPTDR